METHASIEIADYDDTWPSQFAGLADRVRAGLGDLVRRVEHVGSTAVPGLPAKPIIDLDVVVPSAADMRAAITRLTDMGYTHEGHLGIPGRHAFVCPPTERRHHLYLLTEGTEELHRHIAFRDALREDRDLRDRYSMLKRELADRFSGNRTAYNGGKAEFIESVLGNIEIQLTGGRTTAGVVRIGDRVHRPISARSGFVHGILRHLEVKDFRGAPRFLGLDDQGREVLTFLPGDVPNELGAFSDDQVAAVAGLLRSLHDATTDCELRADHEVVCHGDPSPCNCVFVDGVPRGFIDFDAAHPGTRDEDVGYAAWLWLDFGNDELQPEAQGQRLIAFLTAYDFADEREPLEPVLSAQRQFLRRPIAPPNAKEWARKCLDWTERNREGIEAGIGLARSPTP